MTADELVQAGREARSAGDLSGAAQAFRGADELGSAEGSILLGLALKDLGDLEGAKAALRRADERGHVEAPTCLGNIMWDAGDFEGARAMLERAQAAGSLDAVLNLGLLLAELGLNDEALPWLLQAEERGIPEAARFIGTVLERKGDLAAAEVAFGRAADLGDVDAMVDRAALLAKLGRENEAISEMVRARDLGHRGAAEFLESRIGSNRPRTIRDELEAVEGRSPESRWEGEPSIAPLGADEERLLQVIHRADGKRNEIYMVRRRPFDDELTGAGEPVNFVLLISFPDESTDVADGSSAWKRGPDERSVCIALAKGIANAPPPAGPMAWIHPDVQWHIDWFRAEAGGRISPTEVIVRLADTYADMCVQVVVSASRCLELANRAVRSRSGDQQPLIDFNHERQEFEALCARTRATAADLVADDPLSAEAHLAIRQEHVLGDVATAKVVLGVGFGSDPASFLQGIAQVNAIVGSQGDGGVTGNIYGSVIGG